MRITGIALFLLIAPGSMLPAQEAFRLDFRGPTQIEFRNDAGDEVEEHDDHQFKKQYHVELHQPETGSGAEAWCIGVGAENAAITSIRLDNMGLPIQESGFVSNAITTGPGNEGAVSCVVLSTTTPTTLAQGKPVKIAKIRVQGDAGPDCKQVTLRFVDGLVPPGSGPVNNTVTQDGVVRTPEKGLMRIQIAPEGQQCLEANTCGYILGGAWNFLFPFTNIYGCDAGGPANMLRDWVGDEVLHGTTPQAGDPWPIIQYQVEDGAAGFEATHFFSQIGGGDQPVWTSLDWLSTRTDGLIGPTPGCEAPSRFDCNDVDLQGIIDRLNELAASLGIARISSDGALAVAQTYVANRTSSPVCVDLCFASDDSGQVRVNGQVIINRSACRELAPQPQCDDLASAVLEPGVNHITVLTWEGAGDWGFRLGLKDPETGTLICDSNQENIDFLGTSPEGALPVDGLRLRREVVDASSSPLEIRLTASNVPADGTFDVTEIYPVSGVTIDAISEGGSLIPLAVGVSVQWIVSPSILSEGLTYRVTLPPGARVEPVGIVDGCDPVDPVGAARVLFGAWPRTGPVGFFDDSLDIGEEGHFPGGPGSLAFDPGPDGEPETSDDEYELMGSGDDVWDNGDAFRFAYVKVAGDFQCTVRVKEREFPASGGRWGRYGLMARRDLSPISRYSLVNANLEADPGPEADHERGDGVFYQFRRNHGSAAPNSQVSFSFPDPDGDGPELLNQPNWFRLIRRGPLLSGYASFDGVSWKLIGSDTWYGLAPGAQLHVGPMYSRHSSASAAGKVTFTEFSIGPPPEQRIFEDEEGSPGTLLFQANFDNVPDGELPPGLVANCGGSCAFLPRVIGGRLRLSQEGALGNAASAFLPVNIPLDTSKIIIEYTAYASHSGVTMRPPAGDPNPGDGLALALLAGGAKNLVGNPGGGLGYDGISRRYDAGRPSFAVESDTFSGTFFNEGTGSPGNDGAWHLGINSGGNTNCVALNRESTLPDLFGSQGVRHRIEYTPGGKVSVFIVPPGEGGGAGLDLSMPDAETIVEPLESQGDITASLALTAGTGDESQTSELDDLEVIIVPCSDTAERANITGPTIVPPETRVTLDASGSDAGPGDSSELPSLTYRWSVSGDAVIEGPSDGSTVTLLMGCPVGDGEAIGRVEVDDLRCVQPVTATKDHTLQIRRMNWVSYDMNDDGQLNISDPVSHLNFLFSGGIAPACDEAADYDGDTNINITDPVACLNYLFLATGRPPAKGEGCQSFASCGQSFACSP